MSGQLERSRRIRRLGEQRPVASDQRSQIYGAFPLMLRLEIRTLTTVPGVNALYLRQQ